jgi:branched-chain amino acid transport system permease protein
MGYSFLQMLLLSGVCKIKELSALAKRKSIMELHLGEVNWLQLLVNSIQLGSIYSLVALGLTLILSIMYVVNFAHGEMYMFGGFITYFVFYRLLLSKLNCPILLAYATTLIFLVVVLGLVGFLIEKIVFRPFRGDLLAGLLVSVGLAEILRNGAVLSFGPDTKGIPAAFSGKVSILGASLSDQRIAIIIIGAIVMLALHLFLSRTRTGLAMRATAQDREAAQSMGIDYGLTSSIGFAIGCGLAGLAGFLVVPASYIDPFVGGGYLMKAFIIIIIGGMGSLVGCVIAGFLLGFLESFSSYFFDVSASAILGFLLVIGFLVARPKGLLGHAED